MKPTAATLKGNYTMMGKLTKFIKTKAHFIFPVFKTYLQFFFLNLGTPLSVKTLANFWVTLKITLNISKLTI